jgi:hypothetical protein
MAGLSAVSFRAKGAPEKDAAAIPIAHQITFACAG